MRRSLSTVAAFVIAATWVLGCSDDTGPEDPTPTRVSLSQTQVTLKDGESVTLTATVYDLDDRPIEGADVTWASSNPAIATVEKGTVAAQRPGTTKIAALAGQASATAEVTVTQAATKLEKVSGDRQEGLEGFILGSSLVVRVVDRHGDGVPGVVVSFEVTAGGGTVSPTHTTTDAEGYARTAWRLGPASEPQTVEARAQGLQGSPAVFTAMTAEPVEVAIGQTVGGVISQAGGVHAYTFTGSAGEQIAISFQALAGTIGPLSLEFYEHFRTPDERPLAQLSRTPSSDPYGDYVGRLRLTHEGAYTILVQSPFGYGSYRFQIISVDPRPESVPATVAFGDTIAGESISPYFDVDEFTFTGKAGQNVNILLQPLTVGGSFYMALYEHYGTPSERRIAEAHYSEPTTDLYHPYNQSGPVTLPSDTTYTIVVQASGWFGGPYRFLILPLDPRPESIPSTVAIGDTIDGESISPTGDVDEFTFTATAGQDINIAFQILSGSSPLALELYANYGTPEQKRLVRLSAYSGQQWHHSGRITLSSEGTYTIVVRGMDPYEDAGAYRIHILPINRDS